MLASCNVCVVGVYKHCDVTLFDPSKDLFLWAKSA